MKKYDDSLGACWGRTKKRVSFTLRVLKIKKYQLQKRKIGALYLLCILTVLFICGCVFGYNIPPRIANAIENSGAITTQQDSSVIIPRQTDAAAADILPENSEQVMLAGRTMKNDEKGNPIIEVDDPASFAFIQNLIKVEKMPVMREVDKQAVKLASIYDKAKGAPRPFIEPHNGRINFYFGAMIPRIVCKPLRMTDIELEPNERIMGLNIADNSRWSVSTSTSGSKEWLITHIIIKPRIPDISTNLLIHTDRRTYSIELASVAEGQYMPFIGFLYPDSPDKIGADDEGSWNKLMKEYAVADNYISAKSGEYYSNSTLFADPKNINLNYTVKITRGSNVVWKPTHVYDLAGKTYIVMSDNMKFSEAPTIFEKKDKEEKLLNYRVQGSVYIIDRVFDQAIMVAGKDRVAITRKTPLSASN